MPLLGARELSFKVNDGSQERECSFYVAYTAENKKVKGIASPEINISIQYVQIKMPKEIFMKIKKSQNSYNENTAKRYISDDKPIISVSSEVETQYNWVDGKRTDEVTGYKLFFIQDGVPPFLVKFEKKPSLPPFLSEIQLDKLEAIEIRSNVFFRAEGIKIIK